VIAYVNRLQALEEEKVVWPSMREMLHVGLKIPTLIHLRDITLEKKEPCLSFQVLRDFPLHFSQNVFVKRGYSDCSLHAIDFQTPEKQQEFRKMWNETEQLYGNLPKPLQPRWFSMPYMESLPHLGEIRCYMIGGVFSHLIWTVLDPKTGDLQYTSLDEVTPLEDLV